MPTSHTCRHNPAPYLAGILVVLVGGIGSAAGTDPAWEELQRVRESLAGAEPLAADFEQQFRPSGFSSGDSESGTLYMQIPDCLRWDYSEPFAKSYLLCGQHAYTWNPGETSGRHRLLDAEAQRGLELLRLDVAELTRTYSAQLVRNRAGLAEIQLVPLESGGQILDATLTVDTGARRLVSLGYRDADGNTTHFEIGGYRAADGTDIFQPPGELLWLD